MSNDKQTFYEHDLEKTLVNREKLKKNYNLIYWYKKLYINAFSSISDIDQKSILEIGSGTSPLKMFYPNIITSDVLNLDHIDIIFDCHNIADFSDIKDHSLDVITLTNVLHHLRDPITFLINSTCKLTEGGQIIIVEPYFSILSYPLFKFLHHEPVNFNISRPVLLTVDGPLSSSNQSMPHMIFFSRPEWLRELSEHFEISEKKYSFFSSLSYMITGGISRNFPIPFMFYKIYFVFDQFIARIFPKIFASFFIVRIVAKK
jgi:hypothetical protein